MIRVVGARQHNLKDITVEFPRGAMTICTGPSGSGKSSFAVDTVYTEGQRRYVESLSAYARQFIGQLAPPKVERVEGLSPAICIEQKTTSKSPRSTVGTVTEIYDYMRVLWARIGRAYCPKCKAPIGTQSSDEIVEKILAMGEGEKLLLLAPIEPTGQETYQQLFERERANGYARVRVDGTIHPLDAPIDIDSRRRHDVQLVIDRIAVRRAAASRIADSVEQTLSVGNGIMFVAPTDETSKRPNVQTSKENVETSKRRNVETGAGQSAILRFSQHHSCERCGRSYDELTPHHFSFNGRLGWCEACEGLGVQQGANPSAIIDHPTHSILDGAIAAWGSPRPGTLLHDMAVALAAHIGFDPHRPWNALTEQQHLAFLHGTGEECIEVKRGNAETRKRGNQAVDTHTVETEDRSSVSAFPRFRVSAFRFRWRGFYPAISRATRSSWQYRMRLESLTTEVPCEACQGCRLRPEPAAARIADTTIREVSSWPLRRTLDWFTGLKLDARQRKIAGELLHEITSRLRFLVDVGLDYVSLHRGAATLSGGESQRIQLASQIGTGLTGVLYVLDEPTIGLHPRDNGRLIRALHKLRDLGNTLLLVEHDREVIDASDHVLDFGPGAGRFGGEVTAEAAPKKLRRIEASLTGKYLANKAYVPVPSNRRPISDLRFEISDLRSQIAEEGNRQQATGNSRRRRPSLASSPRPPRLPSASSAVSLQSAIRNPQSAISWLTVHGACENNLREIDVAFPLGRFTCVTGVSGSGKSSLVTTILYPALAARIHRASTVAGAHEHISGLEHVDKVINVDQSAIGNSPNSNAATYTGLFDELRSLFAKLPDSKVRGYTPGRFSFNRPGGRCEACEGMGQRCIEMHFLPDVWVTCENCKGTRYVPETLDVRYRGKNIADVLNMSIAEALDLFAAVPKVRRLLATLDDVGLGYLQLGQSAATLSGGEAQRVKLAAELGRPSTGKTCYILDEPTTGLHFDDLKRLLGVLHRLVDLGNTVICIEHNLDVIKTADWIIDLGPEAGEGGGAIVAAGPPEQIAAAPGSHTGKALRPVLEAGPVEERPVFDPKRHAEAVIEQEKARLDLGAGTRMPWETDGRKWHTEGHRDRKGRPVAWDANVLTWLVETMESVPGMAAADWNDRARVEVKAPGKGQWFCHLITGGRDLIEMLLRVPKGAFTQADLRRTLNVKTLDERKDLPVYGQWQRVQLRPRGTEWEEIRISVRDFADVDRKAFKPFLVQAAKAYLKTFEAVQDDPKRAAPWLADGQKYHLSQQSINPKHKKQWKPALILELVGRFKKLQPDLLVDWCTKTAVMLYVPSEEKNVGKIVTNLGQGLRIELRLPANRFTPTQVERLGTDVEIKKYGHSDFVCFWLRTLEACDAEQLAAVWRGARPAAGEEATAEDAEEKTRRSRRRLRDLVESEVAE